MTVIECKVSSELFQGYNIRIELDYHDSLNSICEQVKNSLVTFLHIHGFEKLISAGSKLIFTVDCGTLSFETISIYRHIEHQHL